MWGELLRILYYNQLYSWKHWHEIAWFDASIAGLAKFSPLVAPGVANLTTLGADRDQNTSKHRHLCFNENYWCLLQTILIDSRASLQHSLIKHDRVETLYSTIYYSKYFIELNFDKSTQYVALWTHKRHPIPRPFGRAMECLLWVLQQKLIVL